MGSGAVALDDGKADVHNRLVNRTALRPVNQEAGSLLAHLADFHALGCPLLLGASRKSIFQKLLGLGLNERLIPSVTVAALAVAEGVQIIRAHDVAETLLAIRTASAIALAKMQA